MRDRNLHEEQYPETTCVALPVTDRDNDHAYPRVRFELEEADVSYRRAADFRNVNILDLLCLQHEYEIVVPTPALPSIAPGSLRV